MITCPGCGVVSAPNDHSNLPTYCPNCSGSAMAYRLAQLEADLALAKAVLDSAHTYADAVDWTTEQNIYVDIAAWQAWQAREAHR